MATFSKVAKSSICNGVAEMEVEMLSLDSHCKHECCSRSNNSGEKAKNDTNKDQNIKKEALDKDQNKTSNSEKEDCNCNKKTSSQSLFLSPNQEIFTNRSKIYFKNKFTNPKTYHFDLNHSIFHPPRVLA
jgi:hypothetical protein